MVSRDTESAVKARSLVGEEGLFMGFAVASRLSIAVDGCGLLRGLGLSLVSLSASRAYSPGHLALLRFLVASFGARHFTLCFRRVRPPAARDLPAVALAGFLAFSASTWLLGYGQTSVPGGDGEPS